MSVAPREMFPAGQNLSQTTRTPQFGSSMHGQVGPTLPQTALAGYQSPPSMHPASMLSSPPGFMQPTGRPQVIRQAQINSPMILGPGVAVTESPMLTAGEFLP
jgi:hypothetical protein